MRKILIMAFAMTASLSSAGWSTNWPAYEHPRESVSWANDIYTANLERVVAYNSMNDRNDTSDPETNQFWRYNRTNIVEAKSVAKILCGRFLDHGARESAGSWAEAANSYTGLVNVPKFNAISICEYAKLPTNFFDYTPWRGLSGLGGFTNDTTVGHAYGFTNAYTIDGGTNFPGGRTNWYTTDYGWDGLKACLNVLSQTHTSDGDLTPRWVTTTISYSSWGSSGNSANEAYNVAASSWPGTPTTNGLVANCAPFLYCDMAFDDFITNYWSVQMYSAGSQAIIKWDSQSEEDPKFKVDTYIYNDTNTFFFYSSFHSVYDAVGTDVPDGWGKAGAGTVTDLSPTGSSYKLGILYGYTTQPPEPADPEPLGEPYGTTKGWSIDQGTTPFYEYNIDAIYSWTGFAMIDTNSYFGE